MMRLLAYRIVAFFAANPDDVLDVEVVQVKFDICDRDNARQAMRRLMRSGWVTLVRAGVNRSPSQYGAGPELLKVIGRAR